MIKDENNEMESDQEDGVESEREEDDLCENDEVL